jgi:hypothetical protein
MQTNIDNCLFEGKRFAIVDDRAPIRYLSREEFESMQRLNPRLMAMKAGDLVYLTELPPAS